MLFWWIGGERSPTCGGGSRICGVVVDLCGSGVCVVVVMKWW